LDGLQVVEEGIAISAGCRISGIQCLRHRYNII
jgi:hypothetical protein